MNKLGLAAFENTSALYEELGQDLLENEARQLETQLSVFQAALQYFAQQHGHKIRTNSAFRHQFAQMCSAIGVDPLAGSSLNKKSASLWSSLLGRQVNDFYFELAVRVIELCRQTRNENGGLISVKEVQSRLGDMSTQSSAIDVTCDDIETSVASLKSLGNGFDLVTMGNTRMIRSVPSELNKDQASILEACQALGYVSLGILADNLDWTRERSQAAIDDLLRAGMIWVDEVEGQPLLYWIPRWDTM